MIRISLMLLLCLAGGLSARADTYRWTDDKGVVSFSDDPLQIPPWKNPAMWITVLLLPLVAYLASQRQLQQGEALRNLTEAMEIEWRKCSRYGGEQPTDILVGSKFLDAYRKDAKDTVDRQIIIQGNGRTSPAMNAGVTGIFFKGIELTWCPVLDQLEADFPGSTIDWDKRCYFLNRKRLQLNPAKGQWKVPRKPPRVYDRYTHYSAMTSRFGLGITKPNTMSVLSIA